MITLERIVIQRYSTCRLHRPPLNDPDPYQNEWHESGSKVDMPQNSHINSGKK